MIIDPVHSTQAAYRTLLSCLSRPGLAGSLEVLASDININGSLNRHIALMGMTLLDSETGFAMLACKDGVIDADCTESASAVLATCCSCPCQKADSAPFVFLLAGNSALREETAICFEHTVQQANRGSLLSPHLGATIILELPCPLEPIVSPDTLAEATSSWTLRGPGISGSRHFGALSSDAVFLQKIINARNLSCADFPMGIDLFLVYSDGRVVGIPRTTIIQENVSGIRRS